MHGGGGGGSGGGSWNEGKSPMDQYTSTNLTNLMRSINLTNSTCESEFDESDEGTLFDELDKARGSRNLTNLATPTYIDM